MVGGLWSAELPGLSLDRGGGGAGVPLPVDLPSPFGVWLRNDAELAVRGGGGIAARSRGDRPGEADTGVGMTSAGIAGAGDTGIGGMADEGVRERGARAGERERTGVEEGVWIGSGVRSVWARNAGGRACTLGVSTRRLSRRKRKSMPYSSRSFLLCTWVIWIASSIVRGSTSELYTCLRNISAYNSICCLAHSTKPKRE